MSGAYRFLGWSRRGLAAGIAATPATNTDEGPLPARATLQVGLDLVGADPVTGDVDLYGPGDVAGIDGRAVLRSDPRPGAVDVEPNYLALVEFDPPDLPWMLTPAAATTNGRMRPWLVLVVVREVDGVTLGRDGAAPLPVLTIAASADARRELPDLAESWAWAHAQVLHDDAVPLDVAASLGAQPLANLSRLICPRRLEPETSYLACVVPAFDHGVARGLGLSPNGSDVGPAWDVARDEAVKLPVYHHWRFATGLDGDVESLAAALEAAPADPQLGTVTVQLAGADPDLATLDRGAPGSTIAMRGALSAPPPQPAVPTVPQDPRVDTVLRARVDEARASGSIGPPLYGEWHRDVHAVPPDGWLAEANATAERRIAAGLGAAVVRANQEDLVQACWDQIGELPASNELFNRTLLSAHAAGRLVARHLAPIPLGRAAQITSSWQERVTPPAADPERRTVAGTVSASSLPDALLSSAYRRMAAARRPPARRAIRAGLTHQRSVVDFATADLVGLQPTGRPAQTLDGLDVTIPILIGGDDVAVPLHSLGLPGNAPAGDLRALQTAAFSAQTTSLVLGEGMGRGELRVIDELDAGVVVRPDPDPAAAGRLGQAWAAVTAFIEAPAASTVFVSADIPSLHQRVMEQTGPRGAVVRRTRARLTMADEDPDPPPFTGLRPIGDGDVPSTVLAYPRIVAPLAGLLDRLPGAWLLPGLEGLPQDRATLVETNPAFVSACLLGANQELESELLWREFPTDRRGTPVRRFWARRVAGEDIGPIHEWDPQAELADLAAGIGDGQLVLVVRGRLLLRYPDMVVYAVGGDASGPSEDPAAVVLPEFSGRMDPDLTYAGFPMTRADAVAAGTWFVLQQQPAAPRFGFDVSRDAGSTMLTWSDVAWPDVETAPGAHLSPRAPAVAALNLLPGGVGAPSTTAHGFGPTAGEVAAATLQRPIRVAIHFSRLLPG